MKRFRCFAPAVATIALMIAATSAAAQKLTDAVPADALVVIKVRNLQDTSNKVAALAQQMGLAAMNPAMADPLGGIQQTTGISEGLDKAGDMAFVILDVPEVPAAAPKAAPAAPPAEGEAAVEGEQGEGDDDKSPPMIILVPVTDYHAFVKGFGEPRNEGDLAIVKFKDQEKDVYVANWAGKYAALSDKKEHLAKKPGGFQVAGAAAKEFDTKDISAYVNMKAIRARALPKLQENREKILAEVEKGINEQGQVDPKYLPVIKAAVGQGLNLFEQLLKETDAGTYSLALSNEGISTTALAEFAQGTQFGKSVSQLKGTNESLLSGLPQSSYLFYGGAASDPKVTLDLLNTFIGPIEKELAGLGDEGKAIQTYLASLRTYIGAVQQSRFGMIAPGGQLGQEAIIQGIGIAQGDGPTIAKAYKEMMQQSEELMALFGSGKAQAKTVVTEKAKTLDGVTLDMFQTQFGAGDAQDPQAQQMQQMMTMMYGPNGLTGYVGVVGNKLIQGTNVSDAVLSATIKAAQANEDVLTKQPGLTLTKKQLPQNRLMEMYIPLDVVVNTGVTYANQFGFPVKLQMPPNLPPIGVSAGTEGTAFRVDSHVPSQLVQSLVMAGMQAFMQMQQGQQPGGPGGL